MVPQEEDDLIDQMLEIKPTEKGSNHVLFALWKVIGHYDADKTRKLECKKDL